MRQILDAGALIALERGNRLVWNMVKDERRRGSEPLTHAGVLAQVWRGGRQARLSMSLRGIEVAVLDQNLAIKAGALLGAARKADAIDAAVIMLASDGDVIFTSDPDDIATLAVAADLHVEVVRV